MTKKATKLPNLETSMTEISELIEKMELSDETLDQSLTRFERGITLVKHCQKILDDAEQKVQILMQSNTDQNLTRFDQPDNDA